MKRSKANEMIKHTIEITKKLKFPLPGFAYYTLEQWKKLEEDEREIVENMLGWDITDFGTGDFDKYGLTVFTFRNGNFYNKERYPKPYAEKLLFVQDGQILPYHYHWSKMEDIINRGGGDLEVTLYNSTKPDFIDRESASAGKTGGFSNTDVTVVMDGRRVNVPAGGKLICKPGSSITLTPGVYHTWQGIPGTGDVLLFEVSTTNDDFADNRFYLPGERIPIIEEDEQAEYLVFSDYPKYTRFDFIRN